MSNKLTDLITQAMAEELIKADPKVLGKIFASMSSEEQAEFFAAVWEEAGTWNGLFCKPGMNEWNLAHQSYHIRQSCKAHSKESLDCFMQLFGAAFPIASGIWPV